MDKLLEAATFYKQNLLNRKFHLIAGKTQQVIEFDIVFAAGNFKHLLGLQKLSDIPVTQYSNPTPLFRDILNGSVTYNEIAQSKYIAEVEPRLNNFQDIKEALSGEELMMKSQHGSFNIIRADFMLTHRDKDYGFAHLFLKEGKEITVPVTFIVNADNSYIQNNPQRWKVLSVQEVTKRNTFTEINPQRIYQETEKAVLVKISGQTPEAIKTPIWLLKNDVHIKDGYVTAVSEGLQAQHKFQQPTVPKRFIR